MPPTTRDIYFTKCEKIGWVVSIALDAYTTYDAIHNYGFKEVNPLYSFNKNTSYPEMFIQIAATDALLQYGLYKLTGTNNIKIFIGSHNIAASYNFIGVRRKK